MMEPLTDLLNHDGFRTGALFGLALAVVVALVATVGRRVLPLAGLAFGAATVIAVDDRFGVEADVVVGLVVLAAGGIAAARWGPVVPAIAAVPGAVLFAGATDLDSRSWAIPTIGVATVLGGVLVSELDRGYGRRGLPPVMLAVTTLGVYLTTPDTEHSAILLGAAVPVALLGWPRPMASLGVGGSFVATALVAWDVVLDGRGRDGAIVGGLACLGMFVIEPLVRSTTQRARGARPDESWRHVLVVAALHVGVVAVCSRVAGLRTEAADAAVISAVAYVVGGALLVWSARQDARPGSRTAARADDA